MNEKPNLPMGRSEWLALLQRCQDGKATCLFVLHQFEMEQEEMLLLLKAVKDWRDSDGNEDFPHDIRDRINQYFA